jgi:hypothetical protein
MGSQSEKRLSILPADADSEEPAPRTAFDDSAEGGRWPFFLNFSLRRGMSMALPYGDVIWAGFKPASMIKLIFASHSITIRGTELEAIYRGILRQSVSEVRECDERYHKEGGGEPFVRAIEAVQRPTEDEDKGELFSIGESQAQEGPE